MKYKLDENGALIFVADKDPKSNENLYLEIQKLEERIEKLEAENESKK